jgi:hypothetical protein
MQREREPSRRRDEPPARGAEPLPQHALLALQRTAGNRAVGAMLARDIKSAVEPADAKQDAAPSGPHVIVPGIGAIPVESYSMSVGKPVSPPSGSRGEEAPKKDKDKKDDELPGGDISFTSLQGAHSADLFRWSLQGPAKDIVIVAPRGATTMRITLKGALITSINVSKGQPPVESWSVNCTAMKFEIVDAAP